jgi:transposase
LFRLALRQTLLHGYFQGWHLPLIRETNAFAETLGGKLPLFCLPPYSRDRNPDEAVWKHLKADTVGRMSVTGKGFKRMD